MLKLMNLRTLAFATGAFCAALGAVTLFAPAASAALSFAFDGRLAPPGGSFGEMGANSVAIDDFNGDTYVASNVSHEFKSEPGVVDVFDSTGTQLAGLDGSLTPSGAFGGKVDVAANNGTGDVYVLDSTNDVVDKFDSNGTYVCQITGSSTPSPSECNGPTGSDTPAHDLLTPSGIAVDQGSGDVYVLDAQNGVADVFSVTGAYQRQIELSQIPGGFGPTKSRGITVSGFNGDVFIAEEGAPGNVYEFSATGAYVTTWTGANTPEGSFNGQPSVAVDDHDGAVYITDTFFRTTDVFNPAGELLTEFSHSYHVPDGTAVDQMSGKVFVSDNAEAPLPQVVDVFGPGVVVPDVTTTAATNIYARGATLNGTVGPDKIPLTGCSFEYGTEISYGHTAPCVPDAGSIPGDGGVHAVSAEVTGLEPGTTYHFRLTAANASGSNAASDESLSTLPGPAIDSATAVNLTGNSAELTAEINPEGSGTTYHFEYDTRPYEAGESPHGVRVPRTEAEDPSLPAVPTDESVSRAIENLDASATYHWRVVATNANATTAGADHTFTYAPGIGGLPDGRAYEMVTPPDKNAALLNGGLLQVAPDISGDGSRLMLSSIQCFGESQSCTAARENEGEPYSFTRTAGGWQTTALAPPPSQQDGNSSLVVNADAGTALFSIATPPAQEDDLYARRSDGTLVDIGPVTSPSLGSLGPQAGGANLLSATPDLSHVVYTLFASLRWPFDETIETGGSTSVYELAGTDAAQPVLIGVSGAAGSANLISTCGTQLGNAESHHALSTDGKVVYFTATGHDRGVTSCPPGDRAPETDELYARIDESRTVAVSRRSPLDCTTTACQSSPPGDARFEDASSDGSKAFFLDTQQLTDNASEDGNVEDSATRASQCAGTLGPNGCNLYEFDLAAPTGENLIDVSAGDMSGLGPEVKRVMAVSADGSHAYFVAGGVLTGAPNDRGAHPVAGRENLYAFERDAGHPGGQVAFIATLSTLDRNESANEIFKPSATPDGRFLVFTSHGDLTADDDSTSGAAQVFRYDAQTGELLRISVGDNGFNDNGNTFAAGQCEGVECPDDASIPGPLDVVRRDPTMSDDGAYVFFRSPVGLTAHALNNVQIATTEHGAPVYAENVYEYHEGHVYLISDGKDTSAVGPQSAVQLLGTDTTGANVFFSTADQLVPQDTDTQRDYYDAHICTPASPCISPSAPPLPPCLGEACHGTPPSTPAQFAPSSATFTGSGNAPPTSAPKPRTAAQLRAAKLAKALKACLARHNKRRRAACKARARERYGRVGPKARRLTTAKSKSRKGGK
jgi:WD40-like Beta Propeller Repeat